MQLDYLQYLIGIKKYGSMNQAAEHLYTSQQQISRAIGKLEEELGCKLFVRGSKGVVLTSEGERLYHYALEYEKRRHALENAITTKYLKDIKGSVTIGAMSTGSAMILPQMLCAYYHDYPNIAIHIVDGSAQEILALLQCDQLDLAIVLITQVKGQYYPQVPQTIRRDVLADGQMCYWVSKKSQLAHLREIDIEEAIRYPVIMQTQSDRAMLEMIYANYGVTPEVVSYCENPYLLRQMTVDGFGICPDIAIVKQQWMLRYMFEGSTDASAIPVKKTADYTAQLCLLSNDRRPKDALRQHVISFILQNRWKE